PVQKPDGVQRGELQGLALKLKQHRIDIRPFRIWVVSRCLRICSATEAHQQSIPKMRRSQSTERQNKRNWGFKLWINAQKNRKSSIETNPEKISVRIRKHDFPFFPPIWINCRVAYSKDFRELLEGKAQAM